MEFNGDSSYNKRMRSDDENMGPKGPRHHYPMDRPHRGNHQSQPMKRSVEDDYFSPPPNYTNKNYGENGPYGGSGGGGGGGGGGYNDYEHPKRRKMEPEVPNHVVLFTVMNPAYPITVDVVNTICQPYGNVQRIVIFKKNGVQAMVEFDSIETATRTKDGLQGADIYSGCCTLRIEYAKPIKLNVFKNDSESWDFTNPNIGHADKPSSGSSRPPLLKEPRFGGGGMNGIGGPRGGGGGGSSSGSGLFNSPMSDRYGIGGNMNGGGMRSGGGLAGSAPGGGPYMGGGGSGHPGSGPMSSMGQPAPPGLPHQGAVLMVYGLPKDKMNADKLFNLLCLYGNVVRVKFLKTKEGCAMVQMGDSSAVERCIDNLNNVSFFKNKMQLGYSKQAFLADVQQPYDLADGTPSFKDYMGNKNNRFMNPEMASKNRIQPPSKILHFFNTPPGLTENDMESVFTEFGIAPPKSMKVFPSKTDRSSSGLLEFNVMSEALEGLVCANHAAIPNPSSKFPFVMKLCFSSSRHFPTNKQDYPSNKQDYGSDKEDYSSNKEEDYDESDKHDE